MIFFKKIINIQQFNNNNILLYKNIKSLYYLIFQLNYCKNKFVKFKKKKNLKKILMYVINILKTKKNIKILLDNNFYNRKTIIKRNVKKKILHKNIKLQNKIRNSKQLNYILHIKLLNSNIICNITDIKGKSLIKYSSGIFHFNGAQKTKKFALTTLLKKIKYKSKTLQHKIFAIHYQGIKKNRKQITDKLKKFINIKIIKIFNFTPHNGCKPKKKIRKKLRKKKTFKIIKKR